MIGRYEPVTPFCKWRVTLFDPNRNPPKYFVSESRAWAWAHRMVGFCMFKVAFIERRMCGQPVTAIEGRYTISSGAVGLNPPEELRVSAAAAIERQLTREMDADRWAEALAPGLSKPDR